MTNPINPNGKHFTAGELAEALAALPPDAPVYVRGYEEGVDYVTQIVPLTVIPFANTGTWYYGEHDVPYGINEGQTESGYELAGAHVGEEPDAR